MWPLQPIAAGKTRLLLELVIAGMCVTADNHLLVKALHLPRIILCGVSEVQYMIVRIEKDYIESHCRNMPLGVTVLLVHYR